MANFIIELPLKVEIYQAHILDKRFNIGQKMYNELLNITSKRYYKMINEQRYKAIKSQLTELHNLKNAACNQKELKVNEKAIKQCYSALKILRQEYKLSEYDFHHDITRVRQRYTKHIDSQAGQKIASQQWKAYEKLFFGNGKKLRFKKYATFNSFEGKSNKTGIRFFKDVNILTWNKLSLPVIVDAKNKYEFDALQNEIAYCRIMRRFIRGNYKYYVQIVFKGMPPTKRNRQTGVIKNELGCGDVGIDIGTQNVAVVSRDAANIFELADRVTNIEQQKRRLLRKMDRSRRATNPDNFNLDGTIKKQGSKKVIWIKSKRYLNDQVKLRELYRKQAVNRKYQHECLANQIMGLGDKFYIEDMRYDEIQKDFGKSIGNKAPAMFVTILNRKLSQEGTKLNKLDTYATRASQFDHTDQSNTKSSLSKRWKTLSNEQKVQRDLYSAFLMMNINEDLKSFNIEKCNERFISFIVLHDLEIMRLRKVKKLSKAINNII